MKPKKSFEITESVASKIIAAAYRDGNIFDRIKVALWVRKFPEARELYESYSATARLVKDIKLNECPDELLESIKQTTGTIKEERSFFSDLYYTIFAKPAVSAMAAVLVVAVILVSVVVNNNNRYHGFTKEEVELANIQTQQALELVGKFFKTTEEQITKEILTDKVSKPINTGIITINEIFSEGNKNENNN